MTPQGAKVSHLIADLYTKIACPDVWANLRSMQHNLRSKTM